MELLCTMYTYLGARWLSPYMNGTGPFQGQRINFSVDTRNSSDSAVQTLAGFGVGVGVGVGMLLTLHETSIPGSEQPPSK